MNKKFSIIYIITILFFSSCYKGQKLFPPSDHSLYNIPYATGVPGEEYLKLDIHWKEGIKNAPIIVYIHGGGWIKGDKSQMDVWSKRMANEGYLVFNVNYRLAPEYKFPTAVNDVMGALLWIKKNAPEYGGDPDRIGLTGGSAGGHLTAVVATAREADIWKPTGFENESTAGTVKAQVPFFGVYDFNKGIIKILKLTEKFLGGKEKDFPENYRYASPMTYVSKNVPPTLLVCGKLDPLYFQSKRYYRALRDAGANVEFITYPLQTHGFDSYMWTKASKDSFEKMINFFDRYLK